MKKSLIGKLISMATVLCIVMTSFVSGATVALAASAEDGNLLANGGFEDGINGWLMNGGSDKWEFTTVDKETTPEGVLYGDYAAVMPGARADAAYYPYQLIPVEANKTYIGSVDVKLIENIGTGNQQDALYYIDAQGHGEATNGNAHLFINPQWSTANSKLVTSSAGTIIVGVAQWTNCSTFYIDNAYFGELTVADVNVKVDGGSSAIDMQKVGTAKTFQLSAEIVNQLGTGYGLESATVSKWELTEAIEGVSINEETGALTVTPAAQADSIGIRITVDPEFVGAPDTYVFEKTLTFIPYDVVVATNLVVNGGFETGDLNGDGIVTAIEGWNIQNPWELGVVDKTTTPNGVLSGNYAGLIPLGKGTASYPYQYINLEANKTYIASGAFRFIQGTNGTLQQAKVYLSAADFATAPVIEDGENVWLNDTSKWVVSKGKVTTSSAGKLLIGIWETYGVTEFYADDLYLGELTVADVNVTVDGESGAVDMQSAKGTKTFALGAEILNQLGTGYGLESATVSKWELANAINGVSINENTGALTVTPVAQATAIDLRITVEADFTGAAAEGYVIEKTLQLIPADLNADTNLVVNGGFEDGVNGWTLQGNWDFGSVSKATTPEGVYSGDYAASLPIKNGGDFPYQSINLEGNRTYIASAQLKIIERTEGNVQPVNYYFAIGEADATKESNGVYLDSPVWKQMTGKVVTKNAAEMLLGIVEWQGMTGFYLDDIYLGELYVKDVNIISEDGAAIKVPTGAESKVVALSAEILNQINTTQGLTQTVKKWELTEAVDGVSINESTGELTVAPSVTAEEIGVRVTFEQDFVGALESDYVFEKTLKLLAPDTVAYTTESGALITDGQLPNGKVKATVTYTNTTDEDINVVIYNVIYKKNGESLQLFKTVVKDNLTVSPWERLIYTEEGIDSIADASDYVLKTFVWNNTLKPLMNIDGLE